MTWLNEYEVEQAARLFEDDPILGPATKTLANLVDVVNHNSDGWPYWAPPSRAAAKLQSLIQTEIEWRRRGLPSGTSADAVRRAYTPIKTFLTRKGLTCEVVPV